MSCDDPAMLDLGFDRSRPLIAVLPEPSAEPPRSRAEWIGRLSIQVKWLTVAQFPNAPLALWLVAKLVAVPASGSRHTSTPATTNSTP